MTLDLVRKYRSLRRTGQDTAAEGLLRRYEHDELFVSLCHFADALIASLVDAFGKSEQDEKS